jgi:hypothetical protein
VRLTQQLREFAPKRDDSRTSSCHISDGFEDAVNLLRRAQLAHAGKQLQVAGEYVVDARLSYSRRQRS